MRGDCRRMPPRSRGVYGIKVGAALGERDGASEPGGGRAAAPQAQQELRVCRYFLANFVSSSVRTSATAARQSGAPGTAYSALT
jgi:hypothetical protein